MRKRFLVFMISMLSGITGFAQGWSPFALSVVPALELPSEDWDVGILRINLFAGEHRSVAFFDIGGLANLATGEVCGLQTAGIYNRISASPGIIQTAGVANRCTGDLVGIQTAGIYSRTDNNLTGVEISPVAFAGTLHGVQIGVFNRVEALFGLQIGMVNYAYQVEGLQIGALNIISDSTMPILPIMNVAF